MKKTVMVISGVIAIAVLGLLTLFVISQKDSKHRELSSCMSKGDRGAREICITNVAVDTRQPEMCSQLTYPELRDDCYLQIAVLLNDPEQCTQVRNPIAKEFMCQGILKRGLAGCRQYPQDYDRRSLCISLFARVTRNLSLCDELTIENGRAGCYSGIAGGSEDLSICDKITWDDIVRKDCYAFIAFLTEHYSLCETEGIDSDSCYYSLAIGGKNITLCSMLSTEENRKLCYFHMERFVLNRNTSYPE